MKIKKYLTKKNIIITSILLVIILATLLIIYLYNNTALFKNEEEIHNDLIKLQEEYENGEKEEIDFNNETKVENKIYSDYVGVSNGTLYIKKNAGEKIKEAAKNTTIGYETISKSNNGILIVEPYAGTNAISCKVTSNTQEVVSLIAYTAENLCENTYEIGSIEDIKMIENGQDNLNFTKIAPNTTYTISNSFNGGINTIFFFDKDKKFISNIMENTFTTPQNASYIKVVSQFEGLESLNGIELKYCLVLGTKAGNIFEAVKTEVGVEAANQSEIYFPMETEKLVIYVDGGEIEINYVTK